MTAPSQSTIREDHEFENLDYPNEDEGIEKLVHAKGTFILWSRKDIIVKIRSSPIVSPWSTEAGGTPTSSMPKPDQNKHPSVTPPAQKAGVGYHSLQLLLLLVHAMQYRWEIHKASP
jgi:hypothetical protein